MSKKLPKKWSPRAHAVFKRVRQEIDDCRDVFLHPATPEIPKNQWATIAWNAAWLAAEATDDR